MSQFRTRSTPYPFLSHLTQSSHYCDKTGRYKLTSEMDQELLLYPSDSDTFEGDQHTPEVPETTPSINGNMQASQCPWLCSVIHIPQSSPLSSSEISDIVGPSPPSSLRGRSCLCLRGMLAVLHCYHQPYSTPRRSTNRRSPAPA